MIRKSAAISKSTSGLRSILAWVGWAVFAVAICLVSERQGFKRSVVHSYRDASLAWIEGRPIYELNSIHGFLYLPSAAALAAPLAMVSAFVQEFTFRAISIGFLAWATWRLSRSLETAIGEGAFLGMSLLIVPTAIGSAMAGQMNIVLAAAMAIAAADMIQGRWNRAAIWMGIGFALKPQMAVFLILAGVIFQEMRWRAPLALLAALLAPFFLQAPVFVIEQYRACWEKLQLAGNPTAVNAHFNDIFGLLSSLGLDVSESTQWLVRLAAVPLLLCLAWRSARSYRAEACKVLHTLAWAACYLMLFNPRTEGGSYVITTVPLAAMAVSAANPPRRKLELALLVLIALGWTASFPISQALHWIAGKFVTSQSAGGFHYWLSPLLALVFSFYLWAKQKSAPLVTDEHPPLPSSRPLPRGRSDR